MYNLGKLNVIIFISGYASVNHCLLGIMCVYHLTSRTRGFMNFLGIMSKFILSKPPGRRLVTAEIHNYLVFSWHLVTTTFYITFVSRMIWGYFSFNITFACIEMSKITMFLSLSILNVSSFLQISLMLNSRTIQFDDKEMSTKNFGYEHNSRSPNVCVMIFWSSKMSLKES